MQFQWSQLALLAAFTGLMSPVLSAPCANSLCVNKALSARNSEYPLGDTHEFVKRMMPLHKVKTQVPKPPLKLTIPQTPVIVNKADAELHGTSVEKESKKESPPAINEGKPAELGRR